MEHVDVIVIGGGHAGVEAAAAAARRGARPLLVTFRAADVGTMSCNPSIGGVGKGHLVREIDALGGIMAGAADESALHRRMLNRSKGAAVRGPRVQADRRSFRAAVQRRLASLGVTLVEGEVVAIQMGEGRPRGVVLADRSTITARAIVLTTGTFLGATLFRGSERWSGGRLGDPASHRLAQQVAELGLAPNRLKTGTPPRLDGRTVNWAALTPQPSDREEWTLSIEAMATRLPQLACAITTTTPQTHDIISANLGKSPLRSGDIVGRGPRYCPSIEDKVMRFADRTAHQVFVEPEGLDDHVIYPNGLSTSLPADVQLAFLRSMPGFERVEMTAAGYAVEYDFADPRNLGVDLQHRALPGLFLAGQINGTTGYEEAGAQGLLAGANAAAHANDLAPLHLARAESYLGVMADDLTLQGVTEPYRMLTARAEHRLRLRADNAWTRLSPKAEALSLLDPERLNAVRAYRDSKIDFERRAVDQRIELNGASLSVRDAAVRDRQLVVDQLAPSMPEEEAIDDWIYAPYIEREENHWQRTSEAALAIPFDFDFSAVAGLSTEMAERLKGARPQDLAQAGRVPGVSPAALTAVHFHLERSR